MHLYKVKRKFKFRDIIASVLLFVVIIGVALFLLNNTDEPADKNGEDLVRKAVTKAAITCYTIEGRYPESLQYMVDNYGLYYNNEKYFVDYNIIGDNVSPQILVATITAR